MYSQTCLCAPNEPKMKLAETAPLRRPEEQHPKISGPWHHARKREQIHTSSLCQVAASAVCVLFRLRRVWLSLFSLAFPLLLFCFVDSHDARFRCLYVVFVMILSWLTAANDPVLVATYPIILCPLLGVAGVKSLAESYFRPVSFLMLGTSLIAAAFSRTGLDTTISTIILNKFTSSPALLCLGLMLCSATLSMWINNASTAVILSPIAMRILGGWSKRLKEECNSQLLCADFGKKVFTGSSWDNPPGPPPLNGCPLGLKSRASTSGEAVSSVAPSKEALAADVNPAHEQADTRTDIYLNRRRELNRRSGSSAEVAVDVKKNNVIARGAIAPARARAGKRSACGEEQECANHAARNGSDTVIVSKGSKFKYRDAASSTSLCPVDGDKIGCRLRRLHNVVLLGIAYSATIGGMSTLNGSFVSPTLVHVLESSYSFDPSMGQENPINFTSWMSFACPLALLCVFLAWLVLSSVWLGMFTTAHAVARLLVHPFSVLFAAAKLLSAIPYKFRKKGLPDTKNPSVAGLAHDGCPVPSSTDNVGNLHKTEGNCDNSKDIEAAGAMEKKASSALSLAVRSYVVEGRPEVYRTNVPEGSQRTSPSTNLETTQNTALTNAHPFAQVEVLLLLAALVSLWLTRTAGGSKHSGWGAFFVPTFVDDSVPVLLLGLFLFFLPLEPPRFSWRCLSCKPRDPRLGEERRLVEQEAFQRSDKSKHKNRAGLADAEEPPSRSWGDCTVPAVNREENDLQIHGNPHQTSCCQRFRQECKKKLAQKKEYTPILTYAYAVKHIEWGALLLLGGGFAMATSIKRTGLDLWVGNALLRFAAFDRPALVASVLVVASALTEVMSNTATANVLLPILNGVARQAKESPLLVLIPATVRKKVQKLQKIVKAVVSSLTERVLSYRGVRG